jgi:proline iminopeptidase
MIIPTISIAQNQQNIYSKTFGSSSNPPIIFIHGGPGYNCAGFELTTAQRLSENGFYVLVYDQRGCGRSQDFADAQFTLKENLLDLDAIYKTYNLTKATLMGHSWGGTIAAFYAEQHPEKVDKLIFVSSPISYPQTLKTILRRSKEIYTSKGDQTNLNYIAMLEKMDTSSFAYSSYLFMHALLCNLYSPKIFSEEAKEIYKSLMTNPASYLLKQNDKKPLEGIFKDIQYTTLNIGDKLLKLKTHIKVYGIYGNDDGLFDKEQLDDIAGIIGQDNFAIISNASHNVFIDQQTNFIDKIKSFYNK